MTMSERSRGLAAGALAALVLAGASLAGCERGGPQAPSGGLPVVTTKSGVRMVLVPEGWFVMGGGDPGQTDEPPHRVHVSAYYLDIYEVPQAEYEKVAGANPSRWKDPRAPVEQIRWADAVRYCNARSRLEGLRPAYREGTWECDAAAPGYRLPTEAEWEYAARAGTTTRYCFGQGAADLKEYAWFKGNCDRRPQAVGTRRPNPWGLYDMYGNVWEWCHDFYQEDYYPESPERDPRGPATGQTRVLRGGCWNSRAEQCRSSYRNDENPGYTDVCFGRDVHGFVGFRCARSAGPARLPR